MIFQLILKDKLFLDFITWGSYVIYAMLLHISPSFTVRFVIFLVSDVFPPFVTSWWQDSMRLGYQERKILKMGHLSLHEAICVCKGC